jgi:hypothetical protein
VAWFSIGAAERRLVHPTREREKIMRLTAALLAGMFLAPVAAHAQTQIYANNFESGIGANWGTAATLANSSAFSYFIGRYSSGNGTILMLPTPTLPSMPAGNYPQYNLVFDLFTIDSWTGNAGGTSFDIWINDVNSFHQTFATNGAAQSFRAPDVGPAALGFGSANDAIYRNISVPFNFGTGGAPHIWIGFGSYGLSSVSVGSWGIDNVRVNYTVVPAPASAALLGCSGLMALRRRRR